MKKFGATLVGIILAAHLTACTSKESREDDMTPPSEETAAVDSELEKVDGAPMDEASAGFVDDQLPEQALGEAPADAAPADDLSLADAGAAPADGDLDLSEPAPADGMATADAGAAPVDGLAADSTLPAEPAPELDLSAPAPETPVAEAPVETPAPTETLTAETPVETPVEETKTEVAAAPKVSAPIQKVKDAPYREGDQLLNAYYIVRPGDTYKKMARTIFGDASRQSDLKKANPGIKTPKVGNKIYYTSTTRPADELAMKSFYEDQGQSADVYVVKEGDTLKSIAANVLGTREGSIELCSLNRDLECKGDLVAGTELRYFKGGVSADSTTVAKSDELAPPAPPAMEEGSLPPMDAPPPVPDMASAPPPPEPPTSEFPPPPDMNEGAATGSMAMNEPPPPPPPPEMAPPPPPPPVEMAPPPPPAPPIAKAPKAGPVDGFTNDDMMMGLGAVGILAAGIAAIMVIRKRRQQKEMASAFGDTQVGA